VTSSVNLFPTARDEDDIGTRACTEHPDVIIARIRNFSACSALESMDFEGSEKPALTKEERAAKKEKRAWDAEKALSDRMKSDDAFRAYYERLKAERRAREEQS
jgi:hypothetical protein